MGLIRCFLRRGMRNRTKTQADKRVAKTSLKKGLDENIKAIEKILGQSADLVVRRVRYGEDENTSVGVIYIEGLADRNLIQEYVLKAIMECGKEAGGSPVLLTGDVVLERLTDLMLPVGHVMDVSDRDSLISGLLSGDTAIMVDGCKKGLMVCSKGWAQRAVEEPSSQTVVRGPKEGFTETLRTNTALIRRRVKDPNLRMMVRTIGRRTKTEVAVMYIKGVANDDIVEEVCRRLDRIDIDGIVDSGYIEELIQDETFTFFPTVFNTERPDVAAEGLLEGRIVLVVDGTPFALLVPALFSHFFQTSEDFSQRSDISTLLRLLRYLCFFLSLLVPSLYVAITTFHQEMIPTPLLISLAAQREGVPFPAVLEALLMEVTFEILREAGIRMPRAVGQAVAIVGALVLGEAAVQAGIVSPAMVIVVSITAISSFAIPVFSFAVSARINRFIFIFLGATFGLYGIAVGLLAMVLHLCSLRSFGVPYMLPFSPFAAAGQGDALVRFPRWRFHKRQRLIAQRDTIRQQPPSEAKPRPSGDSR